MKERLKILRKHLNLTQKEFAQSIGLKSPSTIGNIELGIIKLSDRNISAICDAFNVSETWLRTGNGEMLENLSPEDEFDVLVGKLYAENDSFKKNIIRAMLKLNDDDWEVVRKFTEELKKGML